MTKMSGLLAVGLIEKDTHGDVLWTWVYPSLSAELRRSIMHCCCLTWDSSSSVVPFVYTQAHKHWLYLRTETTDKLPKVTDVCVIVVCADFNPPLHSAVSQILLGRYVETRGNPIAVLEVYLELVTRGKCKSPSVADNGTIAVQDFDSNHWALTQSTVKDTVHVFGMEFIVVFTALLLKKRICVYQPDVTQLLSVSSCLPVLVWHRLSWRNVFPLVRLDDDSLVDELTQLAGGYVAGFTDPAVTMRSELYDVLVNVESKEIVVEPSAKESLVMGRLHRDLATFITQCCADEQKSNRQCVEEIAEKMGELLINLRSLGTLDADGNVSLSAEQLRMKRLPHATETFLLALAAAEGLLLLL